MVVVMVVILWAELAGGQKSCWKSTTMRAGLKGMMEIG